MRYFLRVIDLILLRKFIFLVVFFVIFTLSYAVLAVFDFLPEPVGSSDTASSTSVTTDTSSALASTTEAVSGAGDQAAAVVEAGSDTMVSGSDILPQTLTIDALDRTVTVLNPASRTVASLDAALLKGVVRHPDSATLNQDGNIFILGHSSYLPTVHNRNFQALNGIQTLKWGDTIRMTSADTEYVYRVEKVYKAKASALTIPVAGKGKRLTLATCNSFGSTDDRYIVEAELINTTPL